MNATICFRFGQVMVFDMLSKTVMQMSNPDMKTPAAGSPGRG